MPLIHRRPQSEDTKVQELLDKMEESARRDVDPILRPLEKWRRESERKDVWYAESI